MLQGLGFTLIILLIASLHLVFHHRSARLRSRIRGALEPVACIDLALAGLATDLRGRRGGRELAIAICERRRGPSAVTIQVRLRQTRPALRLWPRGFLNRVYQRLHDGPPGDDFERALQTWPRGQEPRFAARELRGALTREARAGRFQSLAIQGAVLELECRAGLKPEPIIAWLDRALALADELDPRVAGVRVRAASSGEARCPYCRDQVRGEARPCPSCQTLHHRGCFVEAGGCTLFGCAGSRRARQALRS